MSKMAAVQLKHTNSSDILFPDEPAPALDDSFYSQPSTSGYSTYSQEVKYIFHPGAAGKSPRHPNEYPDTDRLSAGRRSSANSAELLWDNQHESRRSACSSGSPGGPSLSHKYGHNRGPLRSVSSTSSDPTTESRYGLSIKAGSYLQPQAEDSSKYSQQNGNVDGKSGVNADANFGQRTAHRPPPYGSNALNKFPRGGPPNPQTPPKPKRLHHLNQSTTQCDTRPGVPLEIYSMPGAHSPGSKHQGKAFQPPAPPPPLPPPPPPQEALDFESFAARRRTWSPPTFSRFLSSDTSQVQAMRSYRSNEQLDQVDTSSGENMYEELDDISASRAPPRITPQSGKLNKVPNERIIKPIACKPVTASQPRYTPQRPSPPSCQRTSSPSCPRPSPSGPIQSNPFPVFSMSPRRSLDQSTEQPSRSTDDSFSAQNGQNTNAAHRSRNIMVQSADAILDWSRSRSNSHPNSSHISSQANSQTSSGNTGSHSSEVHTLRNLNKKSMSSVLNASVVSLATPSPSDSGVGEVEAVLRGKDAEIAQLRETMDRNERAILQVYEEKRQNWHVEFRENVEEWRSRLHAQQQKAFKAEQSLLMQIFQLQQERKVLRQEVEQHRAAREQAEKQSTDLCQDLEGLKREFEQQLADRTRADKHLEDINVERTMLGMQLEKLSMEKDAAEKRTLEVTSEVSLRESKVQGLEWELRNKVEEVTHLKNHLLDATDDSTINKADVAALQRRLSQEQDLRSSEVDRLHEDLLEARRVIADQQVQLNATKAQLEERSHAAHNDSDSSNNNGDMSQLETELCKLRTEFGSAKTAHQQEKEQWMEEKNKVVRYQKHLQLNYVQMMRKNKILEAEIEQLTLELENRDIKLLAEGVAVTEEESVC